MRRRRGVGFFLSFILLAISAWHFQPRFLETRLQSEQFTELLLLFAVLSAVVAVTVRGMYRRDRILLGVSAFLAVLLLVPDLEEYFAGERRFSGAPVETKESLSVEYIDARNGQPPHDLADLRVLRRTIADQPLTEPNTLASILWQNEMIVLQSSALRLLSSEQIQTGKGGALRAAVALPSGRTLSVITLASGAAWWSWDNRVHLRRVMGQVRHLVGDVLVIADLGASPYTDLFAELLWTGRLDSGALGLGPYWTEGHGLLGFPVAAMSFLVRGNYAVTTLSTFSVPGSDRKGLRAVLAF